MKLPSHRLLRIATLLWVAPCSAVGLALSAAILLAGGKGRRCRGALEVSYRDCEAACGRRARALPFRAITFGHVIVAITAEELDRLREHELVHVRQYERWGPVFFGAYLGSSLWQLLKGRHPYQDNYFEIQARALSADRAAGEPDV